MANALLVGEEVVDVVEELPRSTIRLAAHVRLNCDVCGRAKTCSLRERIESRHRVPRHQRLFRRRTIRLQPTAYLLADVVAVDAVGIDVSAARVVRQLESCPHHFDKRWLPE